MKFMAAWVLLGVLVAGVALAIGHALYDGSGCIMDAVIYHNCNPYIIA